jgi:hypothetical protein
MHQTNKKKKLSHQNHRPKTQQINKFFSFNNYLPTKKNNSNKKKMFGIPAQYQKAAAEAQKSTEQKTIHPLALQAQEAAKLYGTETKTVVSPAHFRETCDIVTRGWQSTFSAPVPGGYLKNEMTIRDALRILELALLLSSYERTNDCYGRAKRIERSLDGKVTRAPKGQKKSGTQKTMVSPNHFNEISDILIRAWKAAFSGQTLPQGFLKSEQSTREAMEKCEVALLGLSHARNNDLYVRAKQLENYLNNLT